MSMALGMKPLFSIGLLKLECRLSSYPLKGKTLSASEFLILKKLIFMDANMTLQLG
jgi:hypothetical protein